MLKDNVRLTMMRLAQMEDDEERRTLVRTHIPLGMKLTKLLPGILSNYRNYLLIFE